MKPTNTVGVIVARYQVDELHYAHRKIIEQVLAENTRMIIFLGTSIVLGSNKNPLDYRTRELMLQNDPICTNNHERIVIAALPDQHSDEVWSDELDRRIKEIDHIGKVTLYGGRDSFLSHYLGRFATKELEPIGDISGTEIRKSIASCPIDSVDFRRGVIYAKHNMHPGVHPTIDLAIVNNNYVLLGKKHGETAWRLIGGFVDPTDENFEAAARREGKEESGGKYDNNGVLQGGVDIVDVEYLGSFKINDWRYRSERNKIITTFFMAKYAGGTPTASDDLEELAWVSLAQIKEGKEPINPGHKMLINVLIENLNG